jgi:hypothetical protein
MIELGPPPGCTESREPPQQQQQQQQLQEAVSLTTCRRARMSVSDTLVNRTMAQRD